ncbi:glutamate-rich protein 1 [Amia ocellicauda]|uniref:glutamate-rich protein 1 n=1 Tax=Amia ocellicauda TaxID=2972642 RepID=UPI003463B481
MSSNRKEVFQDKVFKRLYQSSQKTCKVMNTGAEKTSGHSTENALVKAKVNRSITSAEEEKNCVLQRRLYTVCPPPSEIKTVCERSGKLSEPEETHIEGDPADDSSEQRNRRRKRKRERKNLPCFDVKEKELEHAPTLVEDRRAESLESIDLISELGEMPKLSKNKRRKLKKKRHKQKLLSLGLMSRPAAVEFMYQPGEGTSEDENKSNEKKAREVIDFLQATQEIYFTDCSTTSPKSLVHAAAAQSLLQSLTTGVVPATEVTLLYQLKSLLLLQDIERLKQILEEFQDNSARPSEEVSAICSLFKYWVTDILPLQKWELK